MASTDKDHDEPASSGKRDRSPNYPSLTFTDALERARKIYAAEKKSPVSSEVAVQHLGYSKLNGASFPVLGALKRYGLLESAGKGDVRISDDAHFIFVHPDGDPDRNARIRKLAMQPALFGEVLARYPDGLPSDVNLMAKLQTEWHFANAAAAKSFIKALRDAVRLRDSGVAEPSGDVDNNGENNGEPPMIAAAEQAMKPAETRKNPPPPPAVHGVQSRPWDLGDGAVMVIQIPNKISKKNIERLKKYVDALAMEAAIGWEDASSDPEQK